MLNCIFNTHKDIPLVRNSQSAFPAYLMCLQDAAQIIIHAKYGRIGNERNDRKILSSALSQFEQLNLKHEFAKKKLESAINSLEVARQEALTKTRYLVMIDSPSMPDESLWPQPIKVAFITFLLTLFGAGTVSLLVSAIREHLGV